MVLSHAHIDHSGALPLLYKQGYQGPVSTPATRSLCTVMLRDAAAIQESDARFLNRQADRDGEERVEPLFDDEDVVRAIEHMVAVPYHTKLPIAPGVEMTFLDAGHVLGSAVVVLDIEEGGKSVALRSPATLAGKIVPSSATPKSPKASTC